MKKFRLWTVRPLGYETNLRKAVEAQYDAITSLSRLCHEQNRLLVALSQAVHSDTTVSENPTPQRIGVSEIGTIKIFESSDKSLPDLAYDLDVRYKERDFLEDENEYFEQ